jgi:tetratricopeptide (TPR) repeat protein
VFKKVFIILTAAILTSAEAKQDEGFDAVLKAYEQANYPLARKLADKYRGRPEALLIKGLCIMFDNESPNYQLGMEILQKVYSDKSCPSHYRLKAALTLARCAQLFQARREVYGNLGAKVKVDKLYHDVISVNPGSLDAVSAEMFLFEKYADSAKPEIRRQAIKQLENFCREFKGKRRYLVPLRLLAQNRFALNNDFKSAARHLETAYRDGISNPREQECYLYQLGRIYDLKLNNKEKALEFYNEYLKIYPSSEFTERIKKLKSELERKDIKSCRKKN